MQLSSEDPTLIGSYATVSTETYIGISVTCLLTAFLKSFVAVYEDDIGISYTYRGPSKSGSRSINTAPKDTLSHRMSRSMRTGPTVKGWEREEDPIMDSPERIQGLQIMKTVQVTVRDESIELSNRIGTPGV